MRIDKSLLRGRFARRMLVLFFLCALLPVGALAFISFNETSSQLEAQSRHRLRRGSKAYGLAILERLRVIEAEMRAVVFHIGRDSDAARNTEPRAFGAELLTRFRSMTLVPQDGGAVSLLGPVLRGLAVIGPQVDGLQEGKAVVWTHTGAEADPRVFMAMSIVPHQPEQGLLVAEIDPASVWSVHSSGVDAGLCVLDESGHTLFRSPGFPRRERAVLRRQVDGRAAGEFELEGADDGFLGGFWKLSLEEPYAGPEWTIVLSESRAHAQQAVANFKRTFSRVLVLSLAVVLILSFFQIRRSLQPLHALREGTKRISERDFETRINITSRDEFEDLAASFNSMAERLGRQFRVLNARTKLDRAILSVLDTDRIVDTLLSRLTDVVPCDVLAVTLVDADSPDEVRTFLADPGGRQRSFEGKITELELEWIGQHPDGIDVDIQDHPATYLEPLARHGIRSVWLLPNSLNEELVAILSLGYWESPTHTEEDLDNARQMAHQVAVALSNARLIERLDKLNWGTLIALARAIDAKSPWTGGHSERVTNLAVEIGRTMNLSARDLGTLRRGGLLHDIGKIGIPLDILDKPGQLSDAEIDEMQQHVHLGARIIEPIPGLAEALPIVLQHHERWDGSGYPSGLAGESIDPFARIFAVADAFDALVSDRPYRRGLDLGTAIESIRQGAGTQFDPEIVDAFLKVVQVSEADREATSTESPATSTP